MRFKLESSNIIRTLLHIFVCSHVINEHMAVFPLKFSKVKCHYMLFLLKSTDFDRSGVCQKMKILYRSGVGQKMKIFYRSGVGKKMKIF